MGRLLLTVGLVVGLAGIVVNPLIPVFDDGPMLWGFAWLPWLVVGYLILLRRPGNGVGAALYAIGVSFGVGFLAGGLPFWFPSWPASAWLEMVSLIIFVLPWFYVSWLLLVYPTGRLPGRLERIVNATLIPSAAVLSLAYAASTAPMQATGLPSPLQVPALEGITAVLASDESFWVVVVSLLASALLLLVRWRRSAGVERLQYRWLMLGAVLFLLTNALSQLFPDTDHPIQYLWFPAAWAIPVCIGIAILRHRLYEIDRLVSRTLTYTVVVALLGGVYAGLVVGSRSLFPVQGAWPVALSTLLVAFAFLPLARRVQRFVDRRFFRYRYDAAAVVARFAEELRSSLDAEQVAARAGKVLDEVFNPEVVAVWVGEGR